MKEKSRNMIEGMDRLLRRFNKYSNEKTFTVEEIIRESNSVYEEIMKGDTEDYKKYKVVRFLLFYKMKWSKPAWNHRK